MGMWDAMEIGQDGDAGCHGDTGQDGDAGCVGDAGQPKLTGLTLEGGGMGQGLGLVEGLVSKEPISS